jgi:predicted AAA+ superfamily ATPase
MYLKEEIKAEALVRNLPGFTRFLPIAGLMHGQVVNVSSAARDAEISRTTLGGYIGILEDTLLAFRLPAFETRMRVRERRHPKLYWVDPGLARAVVGRYGPVRPEETGALFEGWLAMLLRAHQEYFAALDGCFYWQPAGARETDVDFLLRRGDSYVALEGKHASKVGRDALRGLRAVAPLPGLVKRVLVYTGDRRMKTEDGIEIWPLPVFLESLQESRLFPA